MVLNRVKASCLVYRIVEGKRLLDGGHLIVRRSSRSTAPMTDVLTYIRGAPKDVRPLLRAMRTAIRAAAPEALESISYGMPFYSFPGKSGVKARLCYFGFLKTAVVFYTRPLYLEEHMDELQPYLSTKSSLHFRLDEPIPVALVQKIVSGGVRKHGVDP